MSQLYPSTPSGAATLAPARAPQPVPTGPAHGSTAVALPQPVLRPFRRSFLDRQDPFEACGIPMSRFTFSDSYDLDRHPPQKAVQEIHTRLYKQLTDGNLASTQLAVVDWDDASLPGEPPRRFVVTHLATARDTRVTVNAYFQAYGDHLYYSVRSYILPLLSIRKLVLAVLAMIAAILLLAVLSGPAQDKVFFVVVPAFAIHLRGFIIDLLAGDPFDMALRKQYPGKLNSDSFDHDDATAFLKTNVSLTLGTVATVLEQYGIDTGGLRLIIQQMGGININTGGGSIIGAAIGGIANQATAGVRP